jgi:WD40 repeat protein
MRLYDLASVTQVGKFKHPTGVNSVFFSPDGRWALTTSGWKRDREGVTLAGSDYRVRVWDVAGGWELASSKDLDDAPTVAVFSPKGDLVLSGGEVAHLFEVRKAPAAPAGK